MTDRELMQQALEALEDARGELAAYHEDVQGEDYNNPALNDTITALHERLAQPEQEPVIDRNAVLQAIDDLNEVDAVLESHWVEHDVGTGRANTVLCSLLKSIDTAPPRREWVGLTEEDLSVCDEDGVMLARYWEAKLGGKNA